jgi:hypothetical protein
MLLSFVHVRVLELGGRPPRSRHGGARNRSATSELTGAAMSCLGRSHRLHRACCAQLFCPARERRIGLRLFAAVGGRRALPRAEAGEKSQRWEG